MLVKLVKVWWVWPNRHWFPSLTILRYIQSFIPSALFLQVGISTEVLPTPALHPGDPQHTQEELSRSSSTSVCPRSTGPNNIDLSLFFPRSLLDQVSFSTLFSLPFFFLLCVTIGHSGFEKINYPSKDGWLGSELRQVFICSYVQYNACVFSDSHTEIWSMVLFLVR